MSVLAATVLCPHCGERYRIDSKVNKSGDTVRRGLCPSTPANPTAATNIPWSTEWELQERG